MPRKKGTPHTDPTRWSREEKLRLLQRIEAEEAEQRCADLERRGPEHWYTTIFGPDSGLSKPLIWSELADHHREALTWHWTCMMLKRAGQDIDYYAYFAIWSRGHMKSTLAKYVAICDAALSASTGGYCLYVAGTKGKVRGHAISIETLLGGRKLLEYYPRLGVVKRGEAGQSKGWQADFIYTDAGYVFHFISLDEGVAGANIDNIRPTLIVPDDVDDRDASPLVSERRLMVLTSAVIPARQHNTLLFWAQNYINRHTVLYAVDKGLGGARGVLAKRVKTKPIKALEDIKWEWQTVEGVPTAVILSGTPTWPWYDLKRAQEEMDNIGPEAFMRECQHEVEQDKSGLILPEYDDSTHPITWDNFNTFYNLDPFNHDVPRHWRRYVGFDWGSSGAAAGHACVVLFFAVAAANSPLPGTVFLYHAMTFPASVLAGTVAHAVLNFVLQDNQSSPHTYIDLPLLDRSVADPSDILANRTRAKVVDALGNQDQWVMFHMSHEARAVRDIHRIVYGLGWQPCNPKRDGGVEQMRHYMRSDYNADHPFRPGTKGLSRFYLIVADDEQRRSPTDDTGMKLVRYQFAEWRHRPPQLTAKGFMDERPLKMDDDAGNAAMMIFTHFSLRATPLSATEQFEASIPVESRYSTLLANSPFEAGLTPEQELQHHFAKAYARRHMKPTIERFDIYGDPIR